MEPLSIHVHSRDCAIRDTMPKRLKKPRLSKDTNLRAHQIVRMSTKQDEEKSDTPIPPKGLSEYMSALGSRGGTVSGARRMQNLSDSQRSEIALRAASRTPSW
jgi:hypothetical protein